MFRMFPNPFLAFVALTLLVSCSGHRGDPVSAPSVTSGNPCQLGTDESSNEGRHYLWGLYLVRVDMEAGGIDVVPVRQSATHYNVLDLLEQTPCTDCISIVMHEAHSLYTDFDIMVRNPFQKPNLTGFDVRGIVMFNGSHSFPEMGLIMPDRHSGDGELLNADGYTALYNAGTMGGGPGGLQGYLKGNWSSNILPTATLNGYRRLITASDINTRNAFYAGASVVATYSIHVPPGKSLVFGYAVDACWAPPIHNPVMNPMTDFGPEANCAEPWKIDVTVTPVNSGLTSAGGAVDLRLDIRDWQGKKTFAAPVIECPELFDGTRTATLKYVFLYEWAWMVEVTNEKSAEPGNYECLIMVWPEANNNHPPWLNFAAYQICTLTVEEFDNHAPVVSISAFPQTQTVGKDIDFRDSGTTDSDGDPIVKFEWDWNNDGTFDEEGTPVQHSWDTPGYYLVQCRATDKWGTSGKLEEPFGVMIEDSDFGWARGWNADWKVHAALDEENNAYAGGMVTGSSADLDPGSDTAFTSTYSVYLSKFDPAGNYLWSCIWNIPDPNEGSGVKSYYVTNIIPAVSSGNVYVGGFFEGSLDLDPGSGVDLHDVSGWVLDGFLVCLDEDGNYRWGRTWDATVSAVAADSAGNVYVVGPGGNDMDFDPGPGTDILSGSAYVSKFDSQGNYQWARAWGSGSVHGEYVMCQGSDIAVIGEFDSALAIDFDPGAGVDMHASNGEYDVYVAKLNSSGDFQWARTWGGSQDDSGDCVTLDDSGNVYCTGSSNGTVDFDPGPGVDEHSTGGAFLSKLDSQGDFEWARTFGNPTFMYSYGVALNGGGNPAVCGLYRGPADFDPGADFDIHVTPPHSSGIFVSMYGSNGDYIWTQTWVAEQSYSGGSCDDIKCDIKGNLIVTGYLPNYGLDLDPGPGVNAVERGVFVMKLLPNGYW